MEISLTLLLVKGLLLCIGTVASLDEESASCSSTFPISNFVIPSVCETHHHFLHLAAQRSLADLLQVLQARKNLMLHLELCLHAELCAFLNPERLVLELLERAGGLEVDDYVGTAFDLEAEREDDAFAGIVGVAQSLAAAQAE